MNLIDETKKEIHAITDCLAAINGYFDLGEYNKASIICEECKAKLSDIASKLKDLDE